MEEEEKDDGIILGVCARLSELTTLNVWVIRFIFLAMMGSGGGGSLIYLALYFLLD